MGSENKEAIDFNCPKCGHTFDGNEYLIESSIFSIPICLRCECGHAFSVKAKAKNVEWIIENE